MEGSAHSPTIRAPTEPKPIPPRPQPKNKQFTGNKRAKSTTVLSPSSLVPANHVPNQPIEYELVGMLKSNERYPDDLKRTKVLLSIPAPDDECPIALEPITTACLAFLPDCLFIKDSPEYSKMTLPCGHSFSAMVLIYSWCKNSMICPCCRAGHQSRANTNYLPTHFKDQLKAQITASLSNEQIEDERDTIQALLNMTQQTMSFESLANDGFLEMVIGFYFHPTNEPTTHYNSMFIPSNQRPTSSRGHFSMMVRLNAVHQVRRDRVMAVFRPSEPHMDVIRHSPGEALSINITTQMRIFNAGIIDIDSSGEMNIPEFPAGDDGETRTPYIGRRIMGNSAPGHGRPPGAVSSVPISTFEIMFAKRDGRVFIDGITWVPDTSHVHVSLNRATGRG